MVVMWDNCIVQYVVFNDYEQYECLIYWIMVNGDVLKQVIKMLKFLVIDGYDMEGMVFFVWLGVIWVGVLYVQLFV